MPKNNQDKVNFGAKIASNLKLMWFSICELKSYPGIDRFCTMETFNNFNWAQTTSDAVFTLVILENESITSFRTN